MGASLTDDDATDDDFAWKNEDRRERRAWLYSLLLIAVASIGIRVLIHYDFDATGLLYIGTPFLISLAIAAFRPPRRNDTWWRGYFDHTLTALVVFLGSSILLFEGFICVLFFMPIYFFFVTIGFLFSWYVNSRETRRSKTLVSIVPLLVLMTALEGTTEDLSFERRSHIVVTKQTHQTPAEILQNIAEPFNLQKDRHWMLAIFPMPHRIEAGSLQVGDVHTVHTRYHRWFMTNTHVGEMQLQIVDVQADRVKTRFIHDSSFFSSYIDALGTEILLTELDDGTTEIALRIDYKRKLDPAWYFGPLQEFGVARMAEFLIDEVMIRE